MPGRRDVIRPAKIAIVGDRNQDHPLHRATEQALMNDRDPPVIEWLATVRAAGLRDTQLSQFDGFLIAPGSAYRSMDGALTTIRYARENRVPLLGTCGGFQHMVIEFLRNVGGVRDADHAETNPSAPRLAITPLECSLVGQTHPVGLIAGSHASTIYGVEMAAEPFYCNYGLNPDFRAEIESLGLRVSGVDARGEVRIIELPGHPFFFGTLYVPQARNVAGRPHPLLAAFNAASRLHNTDSRAETAWPEEPQARII